MIQRDKVEHFAAGFIGSLAFWLAGPGWMANGAAWAGILKECWDKRHPLTHTADPDDALATALGGLVGVLLRFLL